MTIQFKVGDRIRLRKDASPTHFGAKSLEDLKNRTVYTIKRIVGGDIRPDEDDNRKWEADWIELAPPKTIVVIQTKREE